jgi:hypothetical protein
LPILILCAFARLYVAKIYAFAGASPELRLAPLAGAFGVIYPMPDEPENIR